MLDDNPMIVVEAEFGVAHRLFQRIMRQRMAEIQAEALRCAAERTPPVGSYRYLSREWLDARLRRVDYWTTVHRYDRVEPDATSADAMIMRFDLAPTDLCWKKVAGIECGEPSDPDSETGVCAKHRQEYRDRYRRD
jgi:hypothetical protein